MIDVEVKVMKS